MSGLGAHRKCSKEENTNTTHHQPILTLLNTGEIAAVTNFMPFHAAWKPKLY